MLEGLGSYPLFYPYPPGPSVSQVTLVRNGEKKLRFGLGCPKARPSSRFDVPFQREPERSSVRCLRQDGYYREAEEQGDAALSLYAAITLKQRSMSVIEMQRSAANY